MKAVVCQVVSVRVVFVGKQALLTEDEHILTEEEPDMFLPRCALGREQAEFEQYGKSLQL